ncbi:cytochrome P450 [Dendryphion nanum]|uniref:Cytochrome P450 n=1 Tax=Dendryphion nanum TaxID=256645 RepID=A0A9P9D384_9PLEO|nr:cytochrome P450 [Dendryphion nanum]
MDSKIQSVENHPQSLPKRLLLILLLATTISCFFYYVLAPLFRPLRSVPGPSLARLTRLWYLQQARRGNWHNVILEQHRKYGPIVRIAPNYYSIDDPLAVRTLYGAGTSFVKGDWYSVAGNPDQPIRDVFTELDPQRHNAHRRQINQLYSVGALLGMETAVDGCIIELERRFREFSSSGEVINLQWWLQCYAFDVIGAITVDKHFGFLDRGEDQMQLISGMHRMITHSATVGIMPEFHIPIYTVSKMLGKNGLVRALEFTDKQIRERLASMDEKDSAHKNRDFLTSVLQLHKQAPDEFPMIKVFTTCVQNIGAGSDTTSISLSAIMWHLITNPRVLTKLRAEMDERIEKGQLSDPPKFSETQDMPYLQAIVREGLRIHPAAGFHYQRVVPKGGAEIAGQFFNEGIVVGINAWVAHFNTTVFGEDADQFRPERWLEDKEKVSLMNKYWIPFGHGSRTCIGKNISLLEITKLVPQLVRKFDFHRTDPNIELECEYVSFVKQKNIMVRISER